MSYKTVVAYSRSEAEMERVLGAVRVLLQKFPDAHIIGLYSSPSPIVYADPNGFIDPGMFEVHEKKHNELAQKLKVQFEAFMEKLGTSFEFRNTHSETGTAADAVLTACLTAELLIAGQPDPDDSSTNDETADALVFNASCPVLLIPYTSDSPLAGLDRIVIAYNGKREAARATFDALPLLKIANQSQLVWIDPTSIEGENSVFAGKDMVTSLARHGVEIQSYPVTSDGRYAQDVLKSHLLAERTDVLVMGAYSHSRLKELIFGGMTRAFLNDLPVATFFSR